MSNNISVGPGGANQATPEPSELQNAALLQAFIKQMAALGKFGHANKYSSSTGTSSKDSTPNESAVKQAVKSDILNRATSESVTDESLFDSMATDWVRSIVTTPPEAAKPGISPPLFRGTPPGGPQGTGNPWAKMPYASILISILMNCMQISGFTSFMAGKKQADMTLAQGQVQREMANLKIEIGKKEKQEYYTQAGFALAQGCASLAITAVSVGYSQRYANKKYDGETKLLKDNSKAADVDRYMTAKNKAAYSDQKLDDQRMQLRKLETSKKPEEVRASELQRAENEQKALVKSRDDKLDELNAHKADREKIAKNLKIQNQAIKDKEAEVSTLKNRETELTQAKTENTAKLNTAREELKEVKGAQETASKEIAQARDVKNAAQTAKAEAESELAANKDDAKKAGLEAKVKAKDDDLKTAQKNLDEKLNNFKEKDEALYGTKDPTTGEMKGGAVQKVNNLVTKEKEIETDLKDTNANKKLAEKELTDLKTDNDVTKNQAAAAKVKGEKLEDEVKDFDDKILRKQAEIDNLGSSATVAMNNLKKDIKIEEEKNKSYHKTLDDMGEPGINQLNDYKRSHPDSAKVSGRDKQVKEDVDKMHSAKTQQYESRTNDPTTGQHVKDNYYRNFTFSMQILDGAVKSILESSKDFLVGDIKLEKAQLEAQYTIAEALTKIYDTGSESMRNDMQTAGKNLDGWASFAQQIMQSETDRFGFKR